MDKPIIEMIVSKVIARLKSESKGFMVEASGRHVHLSEEDAKNLFGTAELTPDKMLSQPGQYLCKEKVRVIGPKGEFKNVAVLGPVRGRTQVEVSMTDMRVLGVKAPVRDSGDTQNAPSVWLQNGNVMIEAKASTIVARRHIHMSEDDAKVYGVKNGDEVSVRVHGSRRLIFEQVLIRVNPNYSLSMHIDYDEANAVGLNKDTFAEIIKTSY